MAPKNMTTLKIKRLTDTAIIPTYAHKGDACFDLYADSVSYDSDGFVAKVKTGIAVDIPDGYAMMVYSRSGHGFKNRTRLSNCVGVIDSGYHGEIVVSLHADIALDELDDLTGLMPDIKPGDRIAQAMLIPVPVVTFEEVVDLSQSERGSNGFGSTG